MTGKLLIGKMHLVSIVFLFICNVLSLKLSAQVLFEGYSKISLGGQFIGFAIQKYEYDVQKKNFISSSLIKYNELGGSTTESLKAYANEALEPISYNYNLLTPTGIKTIEASVKKDLLTIVTVESANSIASSGVPEAADKSPVTSGKSAKSKKNDKTKSMEKSKSADKAKSNDNTKTTKREIQLPKGSFFSTFLAYVILKNPQGLKLNSKYEYQAVAEEDGGVYKGSATVQSEETFKGLHVFKILNEFKDAQFTSLTTDKGEMIYTTASPDKSLVLELMAEPSSAMGGLTVSSDNLRLLFGSIPEGKVNALSSLPSAPASTSISNKATTMPSTTVLTSDSPMPTAPTAAPVNSTSEAPSKLKKLEPQFPPDYPSKEKKGAPPGKGIQTKSEE